MSSSPAEPARDIDANEGDAERLVLYFSALTALLAFAAPTGLASLPVAFFLKDRLHLDAEGLALFGLITNLPLLLGFVFGLIRDHHVFGLRDRGYLAAGALLGALFYMTLVRGSVSYVQLTITIVLASSAFQMASTSLQASMTIAGKRRLMTGRLSGVTYAALVVPQVVTALAGGWLASHVSPRATFAIVAVVSCAILYEAFRPTLQIAEAPVRSSLRETLQTAGAMLRERSLRIVIVILFFTSFSPGWVTPLFYFFTSHLKMTSEAFGVYVAVLFGMEAVGAVLYAWLCKRMTLEELLWYVTIINVASTPLPYWVHTVSQAMIVSAIAGFAFGMANATYFDLLMRSCPKDLEGTGRMLGSSAFFIAQFGADLLGSALYERNGFGLCMILSTLATVLVFPMLLALPRALIATRDGEGFPIS